MGLKVDVLARKSPVRVEIRWYSVVGCISCGYFFLQRDERTSAELNPGRARNESKS